MPKAAAAGDKPKGPKTAYFLFQDDCRPKITAAEPELKKNVAELGRRVGAEWQKLTAEQKKHYEQAAAAAKAAHEAQHGPIQRTPKKAKADKAAPAEGGKKAKKANDGPKRPMSAYMYYANAIRPKLASENPGMPVTEQAKVIGARWGTLTDGDKAKYVAMAAQDKARYEAEKAQ